MIFRFQITFLAAILFQSLQSVAIPTSISAAEQEMPRRHSLIHRSADESTVPSATRQGTVLQPPAAETTHSTSHIGAPKNPVSLPSPSSTHHRPLTKHPAVATVTAPATLSQTPLAAPASGVATGQVTQTTAASLKDTMPAVTAPTAKTASAPLAGVTTTGSAGVASTASAPFAGAASVLSATSAGRGSALSSSGSRSALNLLQNSAVANLLQPTPPPSTQPPLSPSTGAATLTWTANTESDLAGYKVYIGTASGTYSFPGSAFVVGKVTSYTIPNLPIGQTYFFAVSAYDSAGNESPLSAEVSKSLY